RENDAVVLSERDHILTKIERVHAPLAKTQAAERVVEANLRAMAIEICKRWVDKRGTEPSLGNQRAAGAAAAGQCVAHNRARQQRRGLRRLRIQRGEQHWAREP